MGYNADLMRRVAVDVEGFCEAATREFEHNLVRAATKAESGAPGAPVASGELRGAWRGNINEPSSETSPERTAYPIPGAAEVDALMDDFEWGDVVHNDWIADHAAIIEGGRRPDKNGRMIGSDQAPDGFVHHARDVAVSKLDRWSHDG